jgi:predicted N-formylglutamate amidohydrolase
MSDIAEVVENETPPTRLFVTCEHAGNHVPDSFDLEPYDHKLLETHWGWDLGAEAFTRALSTLEDAPAVLSRISRLVCDPNRGMHQDNLFRTHVHDRPVPLNDTLDEDEIEHRLETYHDGYHRVVEQRLARAVERNPDLFLLSVHTFTPELGDDVRDMEIGLLFDDYPHYIDRMADGLRDRGFETAINEPYSGWDGLIYSVERHAREHDLRYLEIEIRNDLLETDEQVAAIAREIHGALDEAVLRPPR